MANSANQKYECPACPEDCENLVLPAVTTDSLCAKDLITESSEISNLYIANPDDEFQIGSIAGDGCWTASAGDFDVINNDAVAGTIRCLCGIGDLPESAQNTKTFSKQRTILIDNTYNLNFDVDNNTKENYLFLQSISCYREVCIWFSTIGCAIYGGPTGIRATVTKATPVLQRGQGNTAIYSYSFQWKGICPPPRLYENPIA